MRNLLITLLGCLLAAGALCHSRLLEMALSRPYGAPFEGLAPESRTFVGGRPTLPVVRMAAPAAALTLAAVAPAHRSVDTTLPPRR